MEDDPDQDYELKLNFSEIALRPLKNTENRVKQDDLGIMVYGRNLNSQDGEFLMRETLKACRDALKEKRNLRTRD